jgi:hypothetical protein
MIEKAKLAYRNYNYKTLDHIWGHLFAFYNVILNNNCGNQYKPPHRKDTQNGPSLVKLTIDLESYNRNYNAFYN